MIYIKQALINFKWNLYGKYYYFGIWIMFTVLLGCFTAATTFSEDYISEEIRKRFFKASACLGIIHISLELDLGAETYLPVPKYFSFRYISAEIDAKIPNPKLMLKVKTNAKS